MIGAATATLSLHPDHLADLRKSGLADGTIRAAGLYSVRPCDLSRIVGFVPQGVTSALAFPYAGDGGFSRVKMFPSYRDKDGHTVKYLQRKGTGARLYIPPGCEAVLRDASIPLAITEGEKKALKLTQEGTLALGIGGLWNWFARGEPIPDLDKVTWSGRLVTMIPDSDVWNRPDLLQAVYALAKELEVRGATVLIAVIPHGEQKQGIDDYLQAGGVLESLAMIPLTDPCFASAARWWEVWRQRADQQAPIPTLEPSWPTLAPEALYGLAGEVVAAIDPYTEADPVGTLAHLLAGFGNLISSGAHAKVQHDHHPGRFNLALVGCTSAGRKGTAWSTPRHLLAQVDEVWARSRVKTGLSSGEGLIYPVRDAREEQQAIKDRGRVTDYQTVIVDAGEPDKRLFIIEPELATLLKRMAGEGNTLSSVIREAWDSGNLSTLTKNSPMRATGAHISIIAHVTRDELLRYLTETERANGFANRFIWLLVRKSKDLPDGEAMPETILARLVDKLRGAVTFAKTVGEIKRDAEARELWHVVYRALAAEKPGLTGAILSRAEAQVLRLSVLYALLDRSDVIRAAHLKAAVALWEYAEASARYIFGDSTGDPVADRIYHALRTQGPMSETDLSNLFSRNREASRIQQALHMLNRTGIIVSEVEATGGRQKKLWRTTK